MIFTIKCPECLIDNEIESDEPVVDWVCTNCNAEPVTSLPTDEEGNLLNG
jgi:hypothetical protein